ncbi:MAG: ATP-binding protein [Chloroflexi bacterium]|nr:ATP-binding protein [Chloroflexota bacterium]
MPAKLSDRLSASRRRRFVGRTAEQTLFESALAALGKAEQSVQIVYVFGPGGVGKTTLLNEFTGVCEEARIPAIFIDARNIEPAADSFLEALGLALGSPPSGSPLSLIAERATPHVILIDTYEILAPLDNWLRETFLPQLPENVLMVMAGREPPSPAWRADPGWQSLVRIIPLRNLSPDESRAYLAKQNIPPEQHQAVLNFTHGHPLALSLVADVFAQRPEALPSFQPESAPDIVKTLLERLVQKLPGPAHRAALEACALVRLTTESLLAEMLGVPDANELFEWLRGLSFVEFAPLGLFPHDLAREALVADVRWRNPDWYAEQHRRARNYYNRRIQQSTGYDQQRHLFDLIFLHRDNSMVRPFLEWQASGSAPTSAGEGEISSLVEIVAQHEGAESARLAERWFKSQPRNVLVFRDSNGRPDGLLGMVALHQAGPDELAADPATDAAWRHLQKHAPLRPGEAALYFRFWMARETYQAVSPVQSLIFVTAVRYYLTTPGLVFTFFPNADPDFWQPMFSYADVNRILEVDFEVGGRRYGVYGHNWRAMPSSSWLALMAEREIGLAPQSAPATPASDSVVVLSEPGFAAAVQDALRDYTRSDVLQSNPLLQSRLVIERAGVSTGRKERAAILQGLLKKTAETLQNSPRESKFYRALHHTYLQPAPTQEQAAELLDLPFSTFRRHLKSGVERVIELLWQQELQGLS